MSGKNWFETQKEKGLIDFKCAVSSSSSSYSLACEHLDTIQALMDANVCRSPDTVLRPDFHRISEFRKQLAQLEG